jgi:hypothetical protein
MYKESIFMSFTFRQIQNKAHHLCQKASSVLGYDVSAKVSLDFQGKYPKSRDYAKTNGFTIYFSPKILDCEDHRVEGLLRHELGHVVLMQAGLLNHSERDADIIAEFCFGLPIYYDQEDVQSIKEGTYPRPNHLPKK